MLEELMRSGAATAAARSGRWRLRAFGGPRLWAAVDRLSSAFAGMILPHAETVGARLRLVIGTLLGSIVAMGLILWAQTRLISRDVGNLVGLKDPKADAVYGMQISLAGANASMLSYLQDRHGARLKRLEESRWRFESFLGRYKNYSVSAKDRASAEKLRCGFVAFEGGMDRLIRIKESEQASMRGFSKDMRKVEALLAREIRSERGQWHLTGSRMLQVTMELAATAAVFRRTLALEANAPDLGYRQRVWSEEERFRRGLKLLGSLWMTEEEQGWARRLRTAFARAWGDALAIMGEARAEAMEQARFEELVKRLDGILDDEIQRPLDQSRLRMRAGLQRLMFWSGMIVFFLAAAAVLFGLLVGSVVTRSITEPVDALVRGTQSAAQGKLAYRVEVLSRDELGRLAGSFNRMLEDLQKSREGLLKEIEDRRQAEEALRLKSRELERSNKELEDFAYISSHDLQEPLRKIISYTEFLAQRCEGRLDADAEKLIAPIVSGAKRMRTLIHDLLAYSRIGRAQAAFAATDMNDVFRQVLSNLDVAVREGGAVVTSGDLPTVMANAEQMESLLQNLVGNAVKFRGPEPPRIAVSAEKKEREWVFSVRDNGIGIDPRFAERVFVIFERLNSQAKYPGTGIGLAMCKRIVAKHGGRIWVESAAAKGSTFYFALPAPLPAPEVKA